MQLGPSHMRFLPSNPYPGGAECNANPGRQRLYYNLCLQDKEEEDEEEKNNEVGDNADLNGLIRSCDSLSRGIGLENDSKPTFVNQLALQPCSKDNMLASLAAGEDLAR